MKTLYTSTARKVLDHVGVRAGVSPDAIVGPGRKQTAHVRRVAKILSRLGYSSPQIGFALNRHHTTVLHHLGRTASQRKPA